MPECVFAPIRLNLINDRKEIGGKRKAISRGRGGSEVSGAENMVRSAVQQPFVRSFFGKYHVTHRVSRAGLDLTDGHF